MKTYINPEKQTTELHEEIEAVQEFYDHAGGGFIPDDSAERIKNLATDKNLLKQDSYGQTGIAALLKLSVEITHDAVKEGKAYAKDSAKVMADILKDIKPEIIKKGEEELVKPKSVKEINFKLSKPEIFMKKLMLTQAEKNEMLFEAVASEEKDAIQTALKIGANIEARDGKGNTPLMFASHLANLESIDTLIAAGADLRAKNYKNETVLHVIDKNTEEGAFYSGVHMEDLVTKLAEKGADVNAEDIHGRSPVMIAQSVETAMALKYMGAKVTEETKDFWKNEGKENLATEFEEKEISTRYEKSTEQSGEEAHTQSGDEAADEQQGRSV